ncbi:MAG: hypothetical protein RLZZ502_1223 [Pseudomonadota bacterium]|jgi:nucleoside-diphosphate-sugar epimerase
MLSVLLIGFGDVAERVAGLLLRTPGAFALRAVKRSPSAFAGVKVHTLDLGDYRSLKCLPKHSDVIVHFAPPSVHVDDDCPMTRHVLARCQTSLGIYVSTTGVYGDRGGQWLSERSRLQPESARAKRRVAAERLVRAAGWMVLRVPGIYAANRLPHARLAQGTPVVLSSEDSYSNHIHADDLARLIVHLMRARHRKPARVINVVDDQPMLMGDYFTLMAEHLAYAAPERWPRAQVQARVSPMLYSFMRESRRIHNQRLREELRFRLRYPSVADFLKAYAVTKT